MSLIAIGMNVLLAGLLIAAMTVGVRLNRRLKALRDSHEGFEVAVRELNLAAVRAEQGLADLRAATDEAVDTLSDRMEKGRALATKLEKLVASAPEPPRAIAGERSAARGIPPVAPAPREAEDRLGALLAMARSRLAQAEREAPEVQHRAQPDYRAEREPLVGRPSLPGRRLASTPDDDLFEDAPLALDRLAGARR